jgi:hypothetical protein
MAINLDFCVDCGGSVKDPEFCPSCEGSAQMVYPVPVEEYVDIFEDHPEIFRDLCVHLGIKVSHVGKDQTICQQIESWPEVLL